MPSFNFECDCKTNPFHVKNCKTLKASFLRQILFIFKINELVINESKVEFLNNNCSNLNK